MTSLWRVDCELHGTSVLCLGHAAGAAGEGQEGEGGTQETPQVLDTPNQTQTLYQTKPDSAPNQDQDLYRSEAAEIHEIYVRSFCFS
jgi:hypothetical protein